MVNNLNNEIQRCKRLGVVGSPSSNTNLTIDVSNEFYNDSLVGNFCIMETKQNGEYTYPLGQITSISLRNPYLERHSIRKIVSVKGSASPLTEQHDVRILELTVDACFSRINEHLTPSVMGSVPPTGSSVYQLNQNVVNEIISGLSADVSYLGRMYNTKILLPMVFRHFGRDKGLGEAYHLGIFGKTGSGKSFLARMIMGCYAKNDSMSMLIIDPQGEYAKELTNKGNLVKIFSYLNRRFEVIDVSKIALTSPDALKNVILASDLFNEMLVRAPENQVYAADLIMEFFKHPTSMILPTGQKIYVDLPNCNNKEAYLKLVEYLKKNVEKIYVSQEPRNRVLNKLEENADDIYKSWVRLANLFSTLDKIRVEDILKKTTENGLILVIDLSGEAVDNLLWNPQIQSIVIKEIARSLYEVGSKLYRQGKSLNTLVAVDEAHRLIPREKPTDVYFSELKNTLIDSIRTTRKYGLGWMFISQSLASLDQEILRQLRIYFFGYGLSWGGELRVLEELVGGGDSINLYQSFKDPQTTALFGRKEYPFMVHGPISPLSSSGTPMFFNALNYEDEYQKINY